MRPLRWRSLAPLPATLALGLLATPVAWGTSPATAQVASPAEAGGPVAPVAALYRTITRVEGEHADFAQRSQQLAPVIDRAFNIPTILQSSVGLRFHTLPPAQVQQLEQVFRQFTIARYVSNFSGAGADTLKVLPDPRPSPYGSDQIVQTQINSGSGSVTKVDYVMRHFPQGWQAVDVLLDGHISQVAVQRSDFGSTLSNGDATPLIESLKRKIHSFSES